MVFIGVVVDDYVNYQVFGILIVVNGQYYFCEFQYNGDVDWFMFEFGVSGFYVVEVVQFMGYSFSLVEILFINDW